MSLLREAARIHHKGHRKGKGEMGEGNRSADLAAKMAARKLPSLKVEAVLIWEDSLVRGEPLTLP